MENYEPDTSFWLDFDAFRRNLSAMIASKDIMYKELAQAVGTTKVTISRYVNGTRNPEIEYVYRIAKYFGVTMDFMLGINSDDNTGMTRDVREVARLYSLASDEDQDVIRTILRKYEDKGS